MIQDQGCKARWGSGVLERLCERRYIREKWYQQEALEEGLGQMEGKNREKGWIRETGRPKDNGTRPCPHCSS